jgi:hypothetical protein
MSIENLTPQVGSYKIEEGIIYYDLGTMIRKSAKSFTLLFKDRVHNNIRIGCMACTKAKIAQKENDLEINITYTALDSRGQITKTVTETFQDNTKQTIKFTVKIL